MLQLSRKLLIFVPSSVNEVTMVEEMLYILKLFYKNTNTDYE